MAERILMAERIAYRVVIWRETETRMWAVHVPDLDLLTQARRIDEVERMARSIIALHLGTDDQRSFNIEVETRLPDELADELARARSCASRQTRRTGKRQRCRGTPHAGSLTKD